MWIKVAILTRGGVFSGTGSGRSLEKPAQILKGGPTGPRACQICQNVSKMLYFEEKTPFMGQNDTSGSVSCFYLPGRTAWSGRVKNGDILTHTRSFFFKIQHIWHILADLDCRWSVFHRSSCYLGYSSSLATCILDRGNGRGMEIP